MKKGKIKTHVVCATSNKGKIKEIGRHFGFYGIEVSKLRDFVQVDLDIEESGESLGDNAVLKSQAYARELCGCAKPGTQFLVISDDTGVFIDGLGGEPGIRVRRWNGTHMEDEEIIEYCLEKLDGVKGRGRNAMFKTVLAVTHVSQEGDMSEPYLFEGQLEGKILEKAAPIRIEGFPLECLFHVKDRDMLLGDLHYLSDEKKKDGFHNHRERAIEKAIPFIKTHL